MSSDKASGKTEDIESMKTLKHNLRNILVLSEACINRLKNANAETMQRRWFNFKDVIIATGRNRINKEIELYRRKKETIEKASMRIYTGICSQLLEADRNYKAVFDILNNSNEYSEKDKNTALKCGDKMIIFLKDIINKMEAIKIGFQKI
jgi:molybdopterin converting factor small subunit